MTGTMATMPRTHRAVRRPALAAVLMALATAMSAIIPTLPVVGSLHRSRRPISCCLGGSGSGRAAPTSPSPSGDVHMPGARGVPAGRRGLPRLPGDGVRRAGRRAAHPDIVRVSALPGASYQGRSIPLVKISDNVADEEGEPEVLFDGLTHAREHLGGEMALSGRPAARRRLRKRRAHPGPRRLPGHLGRARGQPGRCRLRPERPARGALPRVAQEPPAERPCRLRDPRGTDLNRNYAFQWGGVGAGTDPGLFNYRGRRAVLRAGGDSDARLHAVCPRRRRRPAPSGPTSPSTSSASTSIGRSATRSRTCRRR